MGKPSTTGGATGGIYGVTCEGPVPVEDRARQGERDEAGAPGLRRAEIPLPLALEMEGLTVETPAES